MRCQGVCGPYRIDEGDNEGAAPSGRGGQDSEVDLHQLSVCPRCNAEEPFKLNSSLSNVPCLRKCGNIPTLVEYAIRNGDKKWKHTHALASGVDPGEIIAGLIIKETGTCKDARGSMHIFDKPTYFQRG